VSTPLPMTAPDPQPLWYKDAVIYQLHVKFREFLDAAHARRLRVVTELVLNHTSDQHAWFKEARSSRDNPRRDWYVWSDTDDRYRNVRIGELPYMLTLGPYAFFWFKLRRF
jgi:glycosidase